MAKDHLPLTPETLEAAYEYLRTTPPFNKWNLPAGEELVFKVARDKGNHGWLTTRRGKKPKLTISSATTGHTASLMLTVAHESIHLHQYLTGMPQTHGAAFEKLKAQVCRVHGFDPKSF